MTPRPHALRIGLFAIGGLALLVMAVASVFGGRLFADSERAVLHFNGSIYGLQIGAPVVFRGVRMGGVVSIGKPATCTVRARLARCSSSPASTVAACRCSSGTY